MINCGSLIDYSWTRGTALDVSGILDPFLEMGQAKLWVSGDRKEVASDDP